MKINVNYISEKDIDLLFIEKMISNDFFRRNILSKVNKQNMSITEVFHSLTHPMLGESDITIIFKNCDKKYGLLVEDKIDAIVMPKQYERYVKRGKKHIQNGLFDTFDVMIIAPRGYIDSNNEASIYPFSTLYEELISYFDKDKKRDQYKITILENL